RAGTSHGRRHAGGHSPDAIPTFRDRRGAREPLRPVADGTGRAERRSRGRNRRIRRRNRNGGEGRAALLSPRRNSAGDPTLAFRIPFGSRYRPAAAGRVTRLQKGCAMNVGLIAGRVLNPDASRAGCDCTVYLRKVSVEGNPLPFVGRRGNGLASTT